jgi:hypothetical protein
MIKQRDVLQVADDCLCGADPGVYPQTYLGDCLTRAGETIRHQYVQNQEMLKTLQTVAAVMVPRNDDEAQAINDALEVIVKATGGQS